LKRRSAGKPAQPPEDFVLFLDENLERCAPILQMLAAEGVRVELHSAHFDRGAGDDVWLPQVAQSGWCILTKDKRLRYNEWEKKALRLHKARVLLLVGKSERDGNGRGFAQGSPRSAALCREASGSVRHYDPQVRDGEARPLILHPYPPRDENGNCHPACPERLWRRESPAFRAGVRDLLRMQFRWRSGPAVAFTLAGQQAHKRGPPSQVGLSSELNLSADTN